MNKKKEITNSYNNKVVYTLNICPDDRHQHLGEIARTFICLVEHRKKLSKLRRYAEYRLVPEYSFPMKSSKGSFPRLHYHGTIKFNDIMAFLEIGYYELTRWCIFEVDTISDPTYWDQYCRKDHKLMMAHLNSRRMKSTISSEYVTDIQKKNTHKKGDNMVSKALKSSCCGGTDTEGDFSLIF